MIAIFKRPSEHNFKNRSVSLNNKEFELVRRMISDDHKCKLIVESELEGNTHECFITREMVILSEPKISKGEVYWVMRWGNEFKFEIGF